MILQRCLYLIIALVLLVNTGCTLDTRALGMSCNDAPVFEGCFARSPEVVSPEDPEIYIQITQGDGCNISGYGSLGAFSHYVFTGRAYDDPARAELTAITGYDIEADTTNQFRIDLEAAGGSGIVFRVSGYRFGSDGDWDDSSWSDPFYLSPVECVDESGE